jgi:hypothetical protein
MDYVYRGFLINNLLISNVYFVPFINVVGYSCLFFSKASSLLGIYSFQWVTIYLR